jgi:hypothetical protein
MKRLPAIILVGITILTLISIIYKKGNDNIFLNSIPSSIDVSEKGKMYLLYFFTMNGCSDCLEVVGMMNDMKNEFKVVGFVPDAEAEALEAVREQTSAKFEIRSFKNAKRVLPLYRPSLMGVYNNKIYFVIPINPASNYRLMEYLEIMRARVTSLNEK